MNRDLVKTARVVHAYPDWSDLNAPWRADFEGNPPYNLKWIEYASGWPLRSWRAWGGV
jgi:hypothetical protein